MPNTRASRAHLAATLRAVQSRFRICCDPVLAHIKGSITGDRM